MSFKNLRHGLKLVRQSSKFLDQFLILLKFRKDSVISGSGTDAECNTGISTGRTGECRSRKNTPTLKQTNKQLAFKSYSENNILAIKV